MPVFLERFVLPVLVAILVIVVVTNQLELDLKQRIIGAGVLLLLAGLAAYLVHQTGRTNSKILEYRISSNTRLISINGPLRDRLTVLFDNKPVRQPFICIVEFVNKGSAPILRSDFDGLLEVDFSCGEIVSVDFEPKRPAVDGIEYNINGHVVSIPPFILNKRENLMMTAVVTSSPWDVLVRAKIAGGSIRRKGSKPLWLSVLLSPYQVGNIAGMLAGGIGTEIMSPSYSVKDMIIGLSVIITINISFNYLSSKTPKD